MVSFGPVPGVPVGATFPHRLALSAAGVHRPTQAGIGGRADEGAESVVLSGGYRDDEDGGDVVVYTGRGGRDRESGRQVADQDLNRDNRALATSVATGLPVRLVRKVDDGYRYDGLYRVVRYWPEPGRDGFRVWRFELHRLPEDARPVVYPRPDGVGEPDAGAGEGPAPRAETVVQRIVRDTAVGRAVKRLHDSTCQACSTRLVTPGGPYAEAAHIRPLGRPHDGPDAPGNVLCLCPNCHVRFDFGAWTVGEDGALVGLPGRLRTHPRHPLDAACLAYHRDVLFAAVGQRVSTPALVRPARSRLRRE